MARLSLTVRDRRKLDNLKATKSPRNPAGPFADLPWEQQKVAEQWFFKFCARWGADLPQWRKAILIGVARRLAVTPPIANFARVMRGYHGASVQARKRRMLAV